MARRFEFREDRLDFNRWLKARPPSSAIEYVAYYDDARISIHYTRHQRARYEIPPLEPSFPVFSRRNEETLTLKLIPERTVRLACPISSIELRRMLREGEPKYPWSRADMEMFITASLGETRRDRAHRLKKQTRPWRKQIAERICYLRRQTARMLNEEACAHG